MRQPAAAAGTGLADANGALRRPGRDWANYHWAAGSGDRHAAVQLRQPTRTHSRLSVGVFANLHRDLGYLALLVVAARVGLLLVAEPLLLEHLKPSAPLYMLAGLLANLLLLVLVVSSITRLRRRVWPDYQRFKRLHAWLAIACVAFIGWHVADSRFYLNTELKLALAGVAVATSRLLPEGSPGNAAECALCLPLARYRCLLAPGQLRRGAVAVSHSTGSGMAEVAGVSLVRRYVAVLVVALAMPGLAYIIYAWRLEGLCSTPVARRL